MNRSRHLALEIAAAHRRGRPLEVGEPVPGCGCVVCLTYQAGGNDYDASAAELVVKKLAEIEPRERGQAANIYRGRLLAGGVVLPSAGVLVRLASKVPGALRDPDGDPLPPLPVEAARAVSILDICDRLGVELRKVGRAYRGPCPIHDGTDANFTVWPESNRFRCFVCGVAGDAIDLYERVTGAGFAEAVKEMAGV